MSKVSLRDAKAGLSSLVDAAVKGEITTITRHGKPVAAIVPIEAVEQVLTAGRKAQTSLTGFLRSFPADDLEIERNASPGRDVAF
ncbi:type II toxin-antitoxin system Phd/YefM family antitoxin [Rhizobium sp. SG2393]|uniref:type II toxin-antitoxin system Phd/YefM family antitoxin n=1 Tax=Rhizobium sp. SG2393 TaxID=3276279 RepID=UPI00367045DA